jgi:hypothetical protein
LSRKFHRDGEEKGDTRHFLTAGFCVVNLPSEEEMVQCTVQPWTVRASGAGFAERGVSEEGTDGWEGRGGVVVCLSGGAGCEEEGGREWERWAALRGFGAVGREFDSLRGSMIIGVLETVEEMV